MLAAASSRLAMPGPESATTTPTTTMTTSLRVRRPRERLRGESSSSVGLTRPWRCVRVFSGVLFTHSLITHKSVPLLVMILAVR